MIMDNFLAQVQKHMIKLKKMNLDIVNELKIQMFQARKKIEKSIIKLQFGISESNLIPNNQNSFQNKKQTYEMNSLDKNLSTHYNSRAIDQTLSEGYQISKLTSNINKQNQDPNRRVCTDISVIQQFPLKNNNAQDLGYQQQIYNQLNVLANDQSIEINTEQVRKKYQKFISPSAGWTVSADPLRQRGQLKGNQEPHPFCTQFAHEGSEQNQSQSQNLKKDYDLFRFRQIDDHKFSRTNTIQQMYQCEQNNSSGGF